MNDFQRIIRHTNARIAALQDQLGREEPLSDPGELAWFRYGITRVSIDPFGYLRAKLHADEDEIRHTARLYAAIQEGFAEYVSTLLAITQDLADDAAFQAESEAEVLSIQQRLADGGYAPDAWLYWCLAHSYVCGTFAHAFPAQLLETFPTMARRYHDLLKSHEPEDGPRMLAMQLALQDCLMCPREEGWRDSVTRN
jgi:hypothetical protein